MLGEETFNLLADCVTVLRGGVNVDVAHAVFDVQVVFGVVTPAKTPPEVVKRLETGIGKVLAREDVREKFSALGIRVANPTTADAFGRRIRQEVAVWTPVVKELNIHLD